MGVLLVVAVLSQLPTLSDSDSFTASDDTYYGSVAARCIWTDGVDVVDVYAVDDGSGGASAAYGDTGTITWTGEPILDLRIFKAASAQYGLTNALSAPNQAVFDAVDASEYCSAWPAICLVEDETVDAVKALSKRVATAANVGMMAVGLCLGFAMWAMILKTKDLSSLLFR